MAKNKSDRLHNKGCYHKGQYNVTFFCTKGLSIQTKSGWQPLLPSAKGLSFTFMYLLSCKSQSFSLNSFLFLSFGKHHVVRKDIGTYIQLDMDSMSYYCWHHHWGEYVGRQNYNSISFYVSGWNVLLMCMRWVLAIIEVWCPRFNRTLIMHANVYDQDQGLTGRYHNTTLKHK